MHIERLSGPDGPMITLAEVKHHLRVDHHHDDGKILGMMASARDEIEMYIQRSLGKSLWRLSLDQTPDQVDTWDGLVKHFYPHHHPWIELPWGPVHELVDFRVLQVNTWVSISLDIFQLSPHAVCGRLNLKPGALWPLSTAPCDGVEITYRAGYDVDTCPPLIRQILLDHVYALYHGADTRDISIKMVWLDQFRPVRLT